MKKQVQEIFRNLSNNEIVTNKKDEELLLNYFSKHPEIERKNGDGFKCFKRIRNEWNECLAIEDINGNLNTISINFNVKSSHLSNVISALRNEIEPQIELFRKTVNYGVDKCCFTNEVLTKQNSHIDHFDLDFVEVLNNFFLEFSIDIDKVELTKKGVKYFIADEQIKSLFYLYHSVNTKLRCITAKANLSRPKKRWN
jgi:hypothetical protein